jgi:capsular polysaccharide biosynthesis protein
MLAKRLEEAKIAEVMVTNDVQVIDTATLPERPIKPRKALTLVLAALLGVLLGSGLVVAGELLNKKAKTEEDITNYLQLPILGVVPDANSLAKAMSKDQQNIGIIGKLRRLLWRR